LIFPSYCAAFFLQLTLVTESFMFKRVVPVLGLILLAGPVFAADTPPAQDSSASAPAAKTTAKKHHSKKHHKAASSSDSAAPK
jgi:hypothetical protein